MFHAATSGKQYLAFECLENRLLLSADFDVTESNVSLPKLPPAPAIITFAASPVAAGHADSVENLLGKFLSDNAVQLPPFLRAQIDEFELDELEAAPTQQEVNIQFQDNDDSDVDDVKIEFRVPTGAVESRITSAILFVAKPNHIVHTVPVYFAMPVVRGLVKMDAAVAPEQNLTNQPHRDNMSMSTSVAENVNPIQQATAPVAKEYDPSGVSSEYVLVTDALLASESKPVPDSSLSNITVEGVAPIEPPLASDCAQEGLTDAFAKVTPATRALFSAGLSGNYEAIDLAMSQLLSDLDIVRADAALLVDETILRGVAYTAVVGAIAFGIARRRILEKKRFLNQVTLEEYLALWMYPECSGIPGGPTI